MKVTKFLAVVEIGMDEGRVKEVNSWNEGFTVEDHIASIIQDHVQDKGLLCKLAVLEGDLYNDVKEYAHEVSNHKAVVALEQEILDSKQCVGGSCED